MYMCITIPTEPDTPLSDANHVGSLDLQGVFYVGIDRFSKGVEVIFAACHIGAVVINYTYAMSMEKEMFQQEGRRFDV